MSPFWAGFVGGLCGGLAFFGALAGVMFACYAADDEPLVGGDDKG